MNNTKHLLAGFVAGLIIAMVPACGTPSECSATTCPTGCCDSDNKCQTSNANACGIGGSVCTKCSFGQTCNSGICFGGNNGGGSGSTGGGAGATGGGTSATGGGTSATGGGTSATGGGTSATGGGTSATGGGTSATGGGTSATGGGTSATGGGTSATGGGTSSGCSDGCLAPNGTCVHPSGQSPQVCGLGGAACAACTVGFDCVTGVCVAPTGGGSGVTGGGSGATGGGTAVTGGGTGTLQPIAGACASTANCQSGLTCKTTRSDGVSAFPSGYCSKTCAAATDCGTGGFCTTDTTVLSLYLDTNICLAGGCTVAQANPQSTCRSGYICAGTEGTTGFCIPETLPIPFGGNADAKIGQACSADSTCQLPPSADLGFCISASLPDGGTSGFTGGYCSANCTYDLRGDFCGSGSSCVDVSSDQSFFVCLKNCAAPGTQSSCRTGYSCQAYADGGICFKN